MGIAGTILVCFLLYSTYLTLVGLSIENIIKAKGIYLG